MANNIVEALRCSVAVCEHDCVNCQYNSKERLSNYPKLAARIPADTVIDGVAYWVSCDVDRIALEAADELEKYHYGNV